jgi:Zn-dependent M28 family amino/carboxypeptidase
MAFGARSRIVAAASALILVFTASPASAGKPKHDPAKNAVAKLTRAVTVPGVLRHLGAFQFISDRFGDTRASGTPGYDKSADYVAWNMRLAGYEVTRQEFEFVFCEETSSSVAKTAPPPAVNYVNGETYDLMQCSGSGDAAGAVVPIDINLTDAASTTSGCEATDFDPPAADVTGKIALLQRGACNFSVKAQNAIDAGAIGVIIMNQGNGTPEANPDRFELFGGNLGTEIAVPVVSVSYFLGVEFVNTAGLEVRITADAISELRTTVNVLAETRHGSPNNVVMVGSHLDSVPAGPGINDNGSGSAALLEVAWQMRKERPRNKVRFAWWGAEEGGLIGSTNYVNGLTEEQATKIKLYLNFDMIASANYTLGIYDGDNSDGVGAGPGPAGSAEIEKAFEAFFASRRAPTKGTDFTGRSDYGPFIAVGIPAGGLFTGAEVPKTADEVATWGGVAGAQLDPCYHAACDSFSPVADGADAALYRELDRQYPLVGNINLRALSVNADAVAAVTIRYAYDTSSLPDRAAAARTARAAVGNVAPADAA